MPEHRLTHDPDNLRERHTVIVADADLDGHDTLYIPDERVVLVNESLPRSQRRRALAHARAHVRLDDQNTFIDRHRAFKRLIHIPPGSRRAALIFVALSLLALMIAMFATLGLPNYMRVDPEPLRPYTSNRAPSVLPAPSKNGGQIAKTSPAANANPIARPNATTSSATRSQSPLARQTANPAGTSASPRVVATSARTSSGTAPQSTASASASVCILLPVPIICPTTERS
jgi:hypothetical protein